MKRLNFILLNGPMGSGKSTTLALLAKKLDRTAVLKIEDIRQLVTGPQDNMLAWKVLYRMCDEYFKNGVSVLLEQTVASNEIVNNFLRIAKKHNCAISFYHFWAPQEVLLQRIKQRKKQVKVPKSLIFSNHEKHRNIKYPQAIMLDTSTMKPDKVVKTILKNLKP